MFSWWIILKPSNRQDESKQYFICYSKYNKRDWESYEPWPLTSWHIELSLLEKRHQLRSPKHFRPILMVYVGVDWKINGRYIHLLLHAHKPLKDMAHIGAAIDDDDAHGGCKRYAILDPLWFKLFAPPPKKSR